MVNARSDATTAMVTAPVVTSRVEIRPAWTREIWLMTAATAMKNPQLAK